MLIEKIVKKGSKYQVQSERGRNMGTYDTRKEAEKRLQQVHYFKYMNESSKVYSIEYKDKNYLLPNDLEDLIIEMSADIVDEEKSYYFDKVQGHAREKALYNSCFEMLSLITEPKDVGNFDDFLENCGILTSRQLFLDIIDGIDKFNMENK